MRSETQTQVSEAPQVMLAGFVATASVGAEASSQTVPLLSILPLTGAVEMVFGEQCAFGTAALRLSLSACGADEAKPMKSATEMPQALLLRRKAGPCWAGHSSPPA